MPSDFAVIFDMDGVIFDTETIALKCWSKAAESLSLPDIRPVFPLCIGANIRRTEEIFIEHFGPDYPYAAFAKQARANYIAHYETEGLPVKPGAREILAFLRDAGVPMAIASSTVSSVVRQELEDADLIPFFQAVIGGDMAERSKPAPDIFLSAAAQFSFLPERCFVIEDSFNGIRAAHNAGMRPLMVPDMLQPTEEIATLTEHVFPSLFEAKDFFEQILL